MCFKESNDTNLPRRGLFEFSLFCLKTLKYGMEYFWFFVFVENNETKTSRRRMGQHHFVIFRKARGLVAEWDNITLFL